MGIWTALFKDIGTSFEKVDKDFLSQDMKSACKDVESKLQAQHENAGKLDQVITDRIAKWASVMTGLKHQALDNQAGDRAHRAGATLMAGKDALAEFFVRDWQATVKDFSNACDVLKKTGVNKDELKKALDEIRNDHRNNVEDLQSKIVDFEIRSKEVEKDIKQRRLLIEQRKALITAAKGVTDPKVQEAMQTDSIALQEAQQALRPLENNMAWLRENLQRFEQKYNKLVQTFNAAIAAKTQQAYDDALAALRRAADAFTTELKTNKIGGGSAAIKKDWTKVVTLYNAKPTAKGAVLDNVDELVSYKLAFNKQPAAMLRLLDEWFKEIVYLNAAGGVKDEEMRTIREAIKAAQEQLRNAQLKPGL